VTRRELELAVIEAARVALKEHFSRFGMASTASGTIALKESVCALDACTEPDLDALNASVAEAVEEQYQFTTVHPEVRAAMDARREAIKPKPRWVVSAYNGRMFIIDSAEHKSYTADGVAALLNAQEEP
jgi:hypothetical protein